MPDSPFANPLPVPHLTVRIKSPCLAPDSDKTSTPTPLSIAPSVYQTEQQRQTYVEGVRNDVYRTGIEGPYPRRLRVGDYIDRHIVAREHWDKLLWLLIMIFLLASAVIWAKEPTAPRYRQAADAPNLISLEQRLTDLEKDHKKLHDAFAAYQGGDEARWEAWKITNATEPEEGQP